MTRIRSRRAWRTISFLAVPVIGLVVGTSASASAPPTEPVGSESDATTTAGTATADTATVVTAAGTADTGTADTASGGGDSAPPVSLPEGYVNLVDDTSYLTVAVPAEWSDIDTTPLAGESGPTLARIAAAPDINQFEETFEVPGVTYVATPFTADPQSIIDSSGLTGGCETIEVEDYSGPIFTGLVQVGENCGDDGGTWNMIVASPADETFTAVVQVQTSSADDQEAFDIVLQSFTYSGDPSMPAGVLTGTSPTGSSVPGDSAAPAGSAPAATEAPTDTAMTNTTG